MERQQSKAKFWTILTLTNLLLIIYPVSMYLKADGDDGQFFPAIAMVCTVFILAITDLVSLAVAYAD